MTQTSGSLVLSPRRSAAHRRGLFLVASAAICWSSGGLIARFIGTDSWTTVFWRCVFCILFLLGFMALRDRGRTVDLFRQMGWAGIGVALCFATASTCFVVALTLTTVADILIIQSTVPFIAALLGWLLIGERVMPRTWLAMAAAVAGIVIMVSNSAARGSVAGDLLAGVIAFAYAGATVLVRRHQTVRMVPAACLAALFGAAAAVTQAGTLAAGPGDLGLLALFGAGQLGVGLVLFMTGARLVPAGEAALVGLLEVILGPIWVWLFLGEDPGLHAVIGGALVLAALLLHTLLDLCGERVVPPVV